MLFNEKLPVVVVERISKLASEAKLTLPALELVLKEAGVLLSEAELKELYNSAVVMLKGPHVPVNDPPAEADFKVVK